MKILTAPILLLLSLSLLSAACIADDDEYENEGGSGGLFQQQKDVASVTNALYKEECGSCHFAYPPGLLPGSSWTKIMSQLDQHFDDNAELEVDVQKKLTDYLLQYSADRSTYRRSMRIMRSTSVDSAPIRITELPYFIHKHNEIPSRMIKGNDKVGSLSNCDACHQRAEQGYFSEREINIPGYGAWDD